jgi:hypothetical protein
MPASSGADGRAKAHRAAKRRFRSASRDVPHAARPPIPDAVPRVVTRDGDEARPAA